MSFVMPETPVQKQDQQLEDAFGRRIDYLRLSVTDRCDFRCVYCMAEDMTFLPRAQVLTLEEMTELGQAFSELGVKKIRLTGGEPLVRRNVIQLVQQLGRIDSLDELTITTNGSQLSSLVDRPKSASADSAEGPKQTTAQALKDAGVKRLNISLDTLDAAQFKELTRTGELDQVIAGIDAARAAGFARIKLNAVVMQNRNADQVCELVQFALERDLDITFIEEMPLGQITEHGRKELLCTSAEIRQRLAERFELVSSDARSGGPARYWTVSNKGAAASEHYKSHIGFISPHSDNFCASCNRVRVTAEGRLLLCLGNEHSVDLKAVMRANPGNREKLKKTIINAMGIKPERHHFYDDGAEQIVRFMNTTGG